MPIDITDLDGGYGILICGHGVVTAEEYRSVYSEHLSSPENQLSKYRYSISDFTNTEIFEISLDNLKEVAALSLNAAKINTDVIVAIAVNKPVFYSLAKLWLAFSAGTDWTAQVFMNQEKMYQWVRTKVEERFGLDNLMQDKILLDKYEPSGHK